MSAATSFWSWFIGADENGNSAMNPAWNKGSSQYFHLLQYT
jgi:hypothetical protein